MLLLSSMDAACFSRVDHPEEIKYMTLKTRVKNAWRYTIREISQTLAKWPFMNIFMYHFILAGPIGRAVKVWVFGRSPAEIVGSNPTGGMDVCLL